MAGLVRTTISTDYRTHHLDPCESYGFFSPQRSGSSLLAPCAGGQQPVRGRGSVVCRGACPAGVRCPA